MPEDLAEMGWEEQQSAIKKRSLKLMGAGLLLVLVFSDPMVDVMNNMGARVGVPPFYVAFILAPLASNASSSSPRTTTPRRRRRRRSPSRSPRSRARRA